MPHTTFALLQKLLIHLNHLLGLLMMSTVAITNGLLSSLKLTLGLLIGTMAVINGLFSSLLC